VNVLFLTQRVPYAPNRGDRARSFHIVKSLASRVNLDVVSLAHHRAEAAEARSMADKLGVRVTAVPVPRHRNSFAAARAIGDQRPLTHVLLNSPGMGAALARTVRDRPPDVVLAYCSSMVQFALQPRLAKFPLVLDLVDVDSNKWMALAVSAPLPKRWLYRREARFLARFERDAAMRASATLVVNDRERDALRQLAPAAVVRVVPNGVDADALRSPTAPAEAPHVVFCGVMNYQPNVDGIRWFARDVWPIVRASQPAATLTIVGSDPTSAVRRLASNGQGIVVTGTVPNVTSHLWHAAVAIAPLAIAHGVQNKVLEAVAAGLPTVVTTEVLRGLPPEIHTACRNADSAEEFARQTLDLLSLSGAERRAIATGSGVATLTWERRLMPLHDILCEAAEHGRQRVVSYPRDGPRSYLPRHEWNQHNCRAYGNRNFRPEALTLACSLRAFGRLRRT
jgi:sugar transferase (PEP-CTERM/EpsH1 system associated)